MPRRSGRRPADPARPADEVVERLIVQLADARLEARRQAVQRLIELGPGARPWVEKAARSDDPDVRLRALVVLRAWEPAEPGNLEGYVANLPAYFEGVKDRPRLEVLSRRLPLIWR